VRVGNQHGPHPGGAEMAGHGVRGHGFFTGDWGGEFEVAVYQHALGLTAVQSHFGPGRGGQLAKITVPRGRVSKRGCGMTTS